jgi:uridine kinase
MAAMHKYKQHVRPRDHAPLPRRAVEESLGDLIEAVFSDTAGPLLIAVGGPGGTGKSWLAKRLAARLGDAAVLRLDDYKTARSDRSRAGIFGPHPDANKMDLIAEHLADIKRGRAIDKPIYDPSTGDAADQSENYSAARFNLVDGEVSTYRQFRDMVDFSIFIDSHWRTQLATRLGRDLDDRDYSLDKALATFLHSNLREFGDHGAESKNWADVHLFCHEDYRLELESVSRQLYQQAGGLLHTDVEEVELAGLIVPILTPFGPDGEIDVRAFVEHLDWLSARGVRRVLTGDVTGELFSLTTDERLELLKLALEYFPGLVGFQAGGGPLGETIALAEQAEQLGSDAIAAMAPIGWPDATVDGVVEYLAQVASAVDLPLILCDGPGHAITRDICSRVPNFILTAPGASIDPVANVEPEHRTILHVRGIATLKQHLQTHINDYPTRMRPPLSSH